MICSICNISNTDGARFCTSCGAGLNVEKLTPQTSFGVSGDLIGSTISGKYRLDAKLGAGGMGIVYRATRLLIGDEVAVKILHSEQRDSKAAERFQREARAAARLKHPNAVTIYDFGITDDGLQYLVMEFVEGESLRRIIKQQGSVTPSVSVEIINQVCAALDEAHRRNIIHRDIKPDNIIVHVTPSGMRVKVLDFGIAKLRDDTVANLTQTGSIVGTPHYMSPEQCLGEELDSRADIYSLGVVLYEMLTGIVPFNSPTPAAVVVQHVNQPPASPRILNASIPTSVDRAVLHALEKKREARPQSAGDLAQELVNAVTSPSLVGPGMSDVSRNQFASTPTLVVDREFFSSGFAMSRNLSLDTPRSNDRGSTKRIVGLTVVVTLILVGLGGLGVKMFLGTSNERSNPAADGSSVRNDETSMNQPAAISRESTRPVITKELSISNPSPEALSSVFSKTLRGAIGRYGVKMSLQRNGNNLSGTYVYTKYGISISLTGAIDGNQNVEMYGYDNNGTQIDVFKGRFVSSFRIEGQWSKPNGSRSLPFTLIQQN